jgi:hypothetical protein
MRIRGYVFGRQLPGPLVKDDIMTNVHAGSIDAEKSKSANDHFRVGIASKHFRGADDAIIDVSLIVEDGTTAGSPSHQLDVGLRRARRKLLSEKSEVSFDPWILISSDDDAGSVGV